MFSQHATVAFPEKLAIVALTEGKINILQSCCFKTTAEGTRVNLLKLMPTRIAAVIHMKDAHIHVINP